jgi:hypothetical protein
MITVLSAAQFVIVGGTASVSISALDSANKILSIRTIGGTENSGNTLWECKPSQGTYEFTDKDTNTSTGINYLCNNSLLILIALALFIFNRIGIFLVISWQPLLFISNKYRKVTQEQNKHR